MPPKIVLVGGFLGAGKTTLLWHTANQLATNGIRVGLIANDQGHNLVDTALLGQQHAVTEVTGGCFCCNFPDLMTSIQELQERVQPEIILAEPVGSCTDILATVVRPLRKYFDESFDIAPFTVLVDPTRNTGEFEPDVLYLYQQQLAEAEVIVLSKSDLLMPEDRQTALTNLEAAYPQAQVLTLSSRTGQGIHTWLDLIQTQNSVAPTMLDIDYDVYAQAEAALGWLNAHGSIQSDLNPVTWSETVLHTIEQACIDHQIAIAHIKLHLKSRSANYKASLTQTNGGISWDTHPAGQPIDDSEFILNARVHTAPAELEQIVRQAFHTAASNKTTHVHLKHLECFSPRPPEPTYHIGLNEL